MAGLEPAIQTGWQNWGTSLLRRVVEFGVPEAGEPVAFLEDLVDLVDGAPAVAGRTAGPQRAPALRPALCLGPGLTRPSSLDRRVKPADGEK